MMKKIVITGASGFIGRHLLDFFPASEYQLFLLSRNPPLNANESNSNVTWVKSDLLRIAEHSNLLSDCDYFIHMAGEKKEEALMHKVNVEGMKCLTDELVKYPRIKLIHVGTSGIYGIKQHPEDIIGEESDCFPDNTYERTKLEAETILKMAAEKSSLPYVILRPSNVFGEYDDAKKLLNLFKALKGGRFFYIGGSANVNYVYVKYLAAVIAELVKKDTFTSEVYNVNSPCSVREFMEISKKYLGVKKIIRSLPVWLMKPAAMASDFFPKKLRLLDSIKYHELTNQKIYSSTKLEKQVLPGAKASLEQGIKNLIEFYQHQGLL